MLLLVNTICFRIGPTFASQRISYRVANCRVLLSKYSTVVQIVQVVKQTNKCKLKHKIQTDRASHIHKLSKRTNKCKLTHKYKLKGVPNTQVVKKTNWHGVLNRQITNRVSPPLLRLQQLSANKSCILTNVDQIMNTETNTKTNKLTDTNTYMHHLLTYLCPKLANYKVCVVPLCCVYNSWMRLPVALLCRSNCSAYMGGSFSVSTMCSIKPFNNLNILYTWSFCISIDHSAKFIEEY